MLLSGAHSAGASALTLATAPSALAGGALLAIDPFTANCELRYVSSVSGVTVTLRSALALAHGNSTNVFLVGSGAVPASWFGAKGDGSTDDHDAVQWGLRQCVGVDVWLHGQGRTYIVSSPLCLPQSHRFQNATIKASASFSPAESTNALLMTQDGSIVSVASADPTTDIITTSTAHNLPADNIGVVFQGSSLPGGLVAGRFYYCANRTTNTFTVSTTSGGSTVDITSTGTGTAFCEVYSANVKSYLDNVIFECNNVTNLNGILISCQQQTQWDVVRVNNAPGFGIQVKGQQADWENVEIINCGVGLQPDNMSFLYCEGLDIEQCGVAIKGINQSLVSSHIKGLHIETIDAPGAVVDFTAGCQNVLIEDVTLGGSIMGTDNPLWVGFDFGSASVICTYALSRVRFATASPSANNIAVRDNYRGKSILTYTGSSTDSADREIGSLIANDVPSSGSFSDGYVGTTYWGIGGKEFRVGRQQNISPVLELTPGSSQTADSLIVYDTSATKKFAITKNGQPVAATGIQKGLATPTYGTTVTPNALSGDWQTITVTDTSAFTIAAPTNPPDASHSQSLTIEILNSSGGSLGTVTWNSAFVMPGGAFTNPASTKKRFVRFEWNGSKWVETSRAGADY